MATAAGSEASTNLIHIDPRRQSGDFFTQALAAQQAALGSLALPEVTVVRRTSRGEPEHTGHATIYQESVRFSDGAVRLGTFVEPDNPAAEEWWSSADPFCTGDRGFNRGEIEQMAQTGLKLGWLHHQGRHRVLPRNLEHAKTLWNIVGSKGVAQAAAQEAAFMKSVIGVESFAGVTVMRRGYSRSAQSANPFAVAVEQEGGTVGFSFHEAEVFPHRTSFLGMAKSTARQGKAELGAIVGIARSLRGSDQEELSEDDGGLGEYARTFDAHVLNIVNELCWINKFRSGEAGKAAQAVDLGARGIRLHYQRDQWAHLPDWLRINDARPGIVTVALPGAHTSGASPEMRMIKGVAFHNIANYAREHGGSLAGVTAMEVLPEQLKPFIVHHDIKETA